MRRIQLSVFALGLALALTVGAGGAHAQSPGAGNEVGGEFKAGQDALANGQYRAAASHFGKVLRNTDISSEQVAMALYLRGTAYEKDGRPAQAIADITSALYLSGLSSAERAKAYLVRGKAYEAVRMNDLARDDLARARNGGVSEQQIARSSETPRSSETARSDGGAASVPAFSTSVASSEGASSESASSAPSVSTRGRLGLRRRSVPTFATSSQSGAPPPPAPSTTSRQTTSFQTSSRSAPASEEQIPRFQTSILPQQTQPKKPPPAPTSGTSGAAPAGWDTSVAGDPSAAQSEDESGTRVGRFFKGLRSRGSRGDDKTPAAPAPDDSGATPPSASPQWSQTTRVASAPQQPSWTSQTSSPQARQTGAAAQPPAAAPLPQSSGSGYRIQLAALRSDAEAQETWKRLQAKHGALLGGYRPSIVKTELGGLGTFYRVQLGPFPDKQATQQLCQNFKNGGLDCFLLVQ